MLSVFFFFLCKLGGKKVMRSRRKRKREGESSRSSLDEEHDVWMGEDWTKDERKSQLLFQADSARHAHRLGCRRVGGPGWSRHFDSDELQLPLQLLPMKSFQSRLQLLQDVLLRLL